MGCACSVLFSRPVTSRHSTHCTSSVYFNQTEIPEIDQYFSSIKQDAKEIIEKLKSLQFTKSYFYHKLCLPSLFFSPDSSTAVIVLVLHLISTGYKIEFIDHCPYLEVNKASDVFSLYCEYIESLHENIVALTSIKPVLQDKICRGEDFMKKISYIADKEGLDLNQKINCIGIMIHNFKIL